MDNEQRIRKTPLVFISYAWKSKENQERVREFADRLLNNGVNVLLDQYDLKEGDNRYDFMKRSVLEADFVLVLCDSEYKQKADINNSPSGVWAESQILTPEVMEEKDSSHIIPILWEISPESEFTSCFPLFLKPKFGFDFSSVELENKNFTILLRRLFGCSEHEKPELGTPPAFLTQVTQSKQNKTTFSSLEISLFNLKDALLRDSRNTGTLRTLFLAQCVQEIKNLQTGNRIESWKRGKQIICNTYEMLSQIRTLICQWLWLECDCQTVFNMREELHDFLEQLSNISGSSAFCSTSWNTLAHETFTYDLFLHIIASLIKHRCRKTANYLLSTSYLCKSKIKKIDLFWIPAGQMIEALSQPPEGKHFLSPVREILKKSVTFKRISLDDLEIAEILIACKCYLSYDCREQTSYHYWYPHLVGDVTFYSGVSSGLNGIIQKAVTHDGFMKMGELLSVKSGDELREKWNTLTACKKQFVFTEQLSSLLSSLINIDQLDTM